MDNKVYKAISRRRVSSPLVVQQLWDSIHNICSQRQQPNIERISRYMSRVHGVSEDEVRRQLTHCIRDGLLKNCKRLGIKGCKVGVEQEAYQIPTSLDPDKDGHDWYCFECHNSGDVICCTSCPRVFHLACIPTTELTSEDVKNTFCCSICKASAEEKKSFQTPRKQLNQLLVFTCARLYCRLPLKLLERQVPSKCTYTSGDRKSAGAVTWVLDEEQAWRSEFLLFKSMDVPVMEAKAQANRYLSLTEFEADAATIVHNIVIYHGVNSPLADQARQLLRDCVYDLNEMRQCRDCYRRSNEKTSKHWFCEPCDPPHLLVYAKQKGYPFWPAKVIKVEDGMYDVRFFGEPHERAKLDQACIRPITTDIATLGIKRTAAWGKACDELLKHQKIMSKVGKVVPEISTRTPSSCSSEEPPLKKQKKSSGGTRKSIKEKQHETKSSEEEEEVKAKAKKSEKEVKTDNKISMIEGKSERKNSVQDVKQETNKEVEEGPPELSQLEQKPQKKANSRSTVEQKPQAKTPSKGRGRKSEEKSKPIESETKKRGRKSGKRGAKHLDMSSDDDKTVSERCLGTKEVGEEAVVSSSCTEPRSCSIGVQTPASLSKVESNSKKQGKDTDNRVAIEKMRRELEKEKAQVLAQALRTHERELERVRAEHQAEIVRLHELHNMEVEDAKRKQWCYNCELEAIYHCCWNTAYCSIECQQAHWHSEHKRLCRRKR